jgi:hypothetical protein
MDSGCIYPRFIELSTYGDVSGQLLAPAALPLGKESTVHLRMGGWVRLRTNDMEKGKLLPLTGTWTLTPSTAQPVAFRYTDRAL